MTDSPLEDNQNSSSPSPDVAKTSEVNASASTSKENLSQVTIEDLGAEEEPFQNKSVPTSSGDNGTSTDQLSEVRRRWNEKYAQNNTTQSQ